MDTQEIQSAVAALLAHQARVRSAPGSTLPLAADVLPAALMPANAQDAYAVQDEMIRRVGAVGGWKVGGATAPVPNCAPVFEKVLFDDPQALAFTVAPETEFECEIAFTFAQDLPLRADPYSEREVAEAIGATRPSIELLAPRFADAATPAERVATLADGLGCGALLLGDPVAGFREVDCATQTVTLWSDGAAVLAHAGGNAAKRLLPLVCWLANHLAQRGLPLRAGQTVTTGTWTGKRPWGSAREVRAAFAGIGQIHVRPASA